LYLEIVEDYMKHLLSISIIFICSLLILASFGMKSMQQAEIKNKKHSRGKIAFINFVSVMKEETSKEKRSILINNLSNNMFFTCLNQAQDGSEWIKNKLEEDKYTQLLISKILGIDQLISIFIRNSKNKQKTMLNIISKSLKYIVKKNINKCFKKNNQKKINILSKKWLDGDIINCEEIKDILALSIHLVKKHQTGALNLLKIIRPIYSPIKHPIYYLLTSDFTCNKMIKTVVKQRKSIQTEIENNISDNIKLKTLQSI